MRQHYNISKCLFQIVPDPASISLSPLVLYIALEVTGHEDPVIVGLSGSINCTTSLQVVRMEWVLVGVGDPVEEREDGGQSLALPLEPETTGLNGAKFTCRITTKNGKKFEETVTVKVKGT